MYAASRNERKTSSQTRDQLGASDAQKSKVRRIWMVSLRQGRSREWASRCSLGSMKRTSVHASSKAERLKPLISPADDVPAVLADDVLKHRGQWQAGPIDVGRKVDDGELQRAVVVGWLLVVELDRPLLGGNHDPLLGEVEPHGPPVGHEDLGAGLRPPQVVGPQVQAPLLPFSHEAISRLDNTNAPAPTHTAPAIASS